MCYVARLCRRSANTVSEAASKSKSKNKQSSLKSRDVDDDVSATIVPSVRAFPTRLRAKHGVKYREEEEEEEEELEL